MLMKSIAKFCLKIIQFKLQRHLFKNLKNQVYDYIITQWLSARLWYLQCIGTGDTTVLYYAISIITSLHTSFLPGLCQGYVICVNDRMEAVSKYTKTQVILSQCFSQYQWICYGFCVVIQFYCVVFIVCLWSNWFHTLHYSVEKKNWGQVWQDVQQFPNPCLSRYQLSKKKKKI